MLWGLPKMLNVLVRQLVISHSNQDFLKAFDRGHIWLSYDPNWLNISIEIKIFCADGPFKQQSPRTLTLYCHSAVGSCLHHVVSPPQISLALWGDKWASSACSVGRVDCSSWDAQMVTSMRYVIPCTIVFRRLDTWICTIFHKFVWKLNCQFKKMEALLRKDYH